MWLPLACPQLGTWPATQACALDLELNWQLLGSQASTQCTEPHQPGLIYLSIICVSIYYWTTNLSIYLAIVLPIFLLKKVTLSTVSNHNCLLILYDHVETCNFILKYRATLAMSCLTQSTSWKKKRQLSKYPNILLFDYIVKMTTTTMHFGWKTILRIIKYITKYYFWKYFIKNYNWPHAHPLISINICFC